jgi:HD-like signal output (HDOD) protein
MGRAPAAPGISTAIAARFSGIAGTTGSPRQTAEWKVERRIELSGVTGCCVVVADGTISFVDDAGDVRTDEELTEALKDHARAFLDAYVNNPHGGAQRIGLVYRASGQSWTAPTLRFEPDVVRALFPIAGAATAQLTNFQRRNRFRSLYQGFEILLAFRRQSMPGVPLYCPALVDRNTTLADYPESPLPDVTPPGAHTPVFEVLNLLEGMPHRERRSDAVQRLFTKISQNVVRPDMRRPPDLALVEDVGPVPSAAQEDIDDPFAEVRHRHDVPVDISYVAGPAPDPARPVEPGALDGVRNVTPALLRRFTTFKELDAPTLEMLSARVPIHDAHAGTCLVKAGTVDEWNYYLLAGTLELKALDNASTLLRAGTEPAHAPVVRLLPRHFTVTARTPVRYLRVHQSLLRKTTGRASPGCPAPEIEAGARSPLHQALERELAGGTYVPPRLPGLAAKARAASRQDGTDARTLARMVETDSRVAQQLIKAAAIQAHHGEPSIDDLTTAISRLGAAATRQLLTAFSLREIFDVSSQDTRKRADEVWSHCTHVAALCFALARATPGLMPERALLAGLLHDIGAAAIIAYVARHPEIACDADDLDAAVAHFKGAVGACLLRKWNFSEEMARVAAEADDWYRDPGEKPDYCDLVLVAQLHSFAGTDRASRLPRMDEIPAYEKLAPGKLTPALTLEILHQAHNQIEETQRLLRG